MGFSDELANLNAQLGARRCKARVEQRKNSLALRATLPPKPGCSGGSRQQRIPLGLPAVMASLAEAELKALTLNTELRNGTFEWPAWQPDDKAVAKTQITRSVFEVTARRLHAEKYASAPERGTEAWRKRWATALNKLPAQGELTLERLVAVIESLTPATSARRETGLVWGMVARKLGMDPTPLREAGSGYGRKQLTPRDIPSDEDIEAAFDQLLRRSPHWARVLGMVATYGCRPSELGDAVLKTNNSLVVTNSKTNRPRVAMPTKSSWVERFQLHTLPKPPGKDTGYAISTNCAAAMRRQGITFQLYSLRHAAAVRLVKAGVPSEVGARLLGHSVAMFNDTYTRWISEQTIPALLAQYNL
jgi:integrase